MRRRVTSGNAGAGLRQGVAVQWSRWVSAIPCNGLGRYETALAEAQAAEQAPELHISMWVLPELIEAASRTGQTRLAEDALGRLAEAISIGQTDWGQEIYGRSRALLSDGAEAERWYREAVDRLSRTHASRSRPRPGPATRRGQVRNARAARPGADGGVSAPRDSLGILTDAILAGERDSGAIGQQKAITGEQFRVSPLEDPMTTRACTRRGSAPPCCPGRPAALWLAALAPTSTTRKPPRASCAGQ
jgi:hypothetical protein